MTEKEIEALKKQSKEWEESACAHYELNKHLLKANDAARRTFRKMNSLWNDPYFYTSAKELIHEWLKKYGEECK